MSWRPARGPAGGSPGGMIRQSGLTGAVAAGSVLTGLLLDAVIAASFGAGRATDSFFVAARIPLGLDAVVMAAATQALVPALTRSLAVATEAATWRLVSILLSGIALGGALLVAASTLFAMPLVRLTAPGLPASEMALAASLAPVVFAMVPLVSCSEVLRALLNARYSFVAPAATGLVLNAVATGLILALGRRDIHLVAWAFVAGAAAQATFMLAFSVRQGFRYRPSLRVWSPEVAAVGRLCLRPLVAAGANPVARVGEQLLVSFLPPGSLTILAYGNRLISAIGGTVFFRSVMVAMVPRLTQAETRADREAAIGITRLGVRIMLALSIPLTALLAVLARPVAALVFQRGRFSRADAALLGLVLAVYSASLIGSGVQRALLAPFFARLDTRTPLRNTLYGVACNLLLLPALVLPFGRHDPRAVLGVAVAYSAAQYVNVAHAWYRGRPLIGNPFAGSATLVLRLVLASLLCAAVMTAIGAAIGLGATHSRVTLLAMTSLVGCAGLLTLGLALGALAGRELRSHWRGLGRGGPAPVP